MASYVEIQQPTDRGRQRELVLFKPEMLLGRHSWLYTIKQFERWLTLKTSFTKGKEEMHLSFPPFPSSFHLLLQKAPPTTQKCCTTLKIRFSSLPQLQSITDPKQKAFIPVQGEHLPWSNTGSIAERRQTERTKRHFLCCLRTPRTQVQTDCSRLATQP